MRRLATLFALAATYAGPAQSQDAPAAAPVQAPAAAPVEAPATAQPAGTESSAQQANGSGSESPRTQPEQPEFWETAPPTWRGGFTAGVLAGLAFGTVSGYPNDFAKIDNPTYRTATSGAGSALGIYLGGAITDWFTFALGLDLTSYGGSKLMSRAAVFAFHLEAFPAFALGGPWRDAGLFGDFGTGVSTIKERDNNVEFAASGALSVIGLGAFFEPWRLGRHLAFGPFGAWHYQWSDSMSRQLGEIGFRGSFYGGP